MTTKHLTQTAEAISQTAATQAGQIQAAVRLIRECRDNGGTVYTCGNGGSAATASHFTNDLVKATKTRAIDLMAQVPLLTAYSNDEGYENALAYIVQRLIRPGDVLLCISVSGESLNVLRAASNAMLPKKNNVKVIALGSQRRGRLAELATVFIEAQSEGMMIAESVHLAVAHAIVAGLTE